VRKEKNACRLLADVAHRDIIYFDAYTDATPCCCQLLPGSVALSRHNGFHDTPRRLCLMSLMRAVRAMRIILLCDRGMPLRQAARSKCGVQIADHAQTSKTTRLYEARRRRLRQTRGCGENCAAAARCPHLLTRAASSSFCISPSPAESSAFRD